MQVEVDEQIHIPLVDILRAIEDKNADTFVNALQARSGAIDAFTPNDRGEELYQFFEWSRGADPEMRERVIGMYLAKPCIAQKLMFTLIEADHVNFDLLNRLIANNADNKHVLMPGPGGTSKTLLDAAFAKFGAFKEEIYIRDSNEADVIMNRLVQWMDIQEPTKLSALTEAYQDLCSYSSFLGGKFVNKALQRLASNIASSEKGFGDCFDFITKIKKGDILKDNEEYLNIIFKKTLESTGTVEQYKLLFIMLLKRGLHQTARSLFANINVYVGVATIKNH